MDDDLHAVTTVRRIANPSDTTIEPPPYKDFLRLRATAVDDLIARRAPAIDAVAVEADDSLFTAPVLLVAPALAAAIVLLRLEMGLRVLLVFTEENGRKMQSIGRKEMKRVRMYHVPRVKRVIDSTKPAAIWNIRHNK
ncbi:hypothetical protein I316_01539 [Kwoniella heveanensis BCC8398]|uniref:Uncharacterized protein n=1 Tax=Kwoniella heveanensis BCC8398 TaxID=1296120 RepID=A0A1B9H0Y8_9TREE|nr:hypothetical protein I316_01539 [Kwoniella heveanensis BCC8398]